MAKLGMFLACSMVVLLSAPGDARAQADEPGLGGAPREAPVQPPPATPSPPAAGQTEPAPAPAPAGPTDIDAPPPVPAPEVQVTGAAGDVLRRARAQCSAFKPCALVPDLLRLLPTSAGPAAARVLGRVGGRRAVSPLAQAATYGATPALRNGARKALARLARQKRVRPHMRRVARLEPDPGTKAALLAALSGVGKAAAAADPDELELSGGVALVGEEVDDYIGRRTKYKFADPDSTRVIYQPTAFTRKPGTWNWTITNLGYWHFDYGLNEHIELGLETVPPVLVLGLFPSIKLSTTLGDKVAIAVRVMGGVVYPYVDDMNRENWHMGLYGGGPILTIGDADLALNISFSVYGVTVGEEDKIWDSSGYDYTTEMDRNTTWIALPHVGGAWRVHRRIKLHLEINVPIIEEFELNGRFWLVTYGMRIMGQRIYGDINMVLPLFEDADEMLKYMPLGFPMLVFGFQW